MKTSLRRFEKNQRNENKKCEHQRPLFQRKKKPPKCLENLRDYFTSEEHQPKTIEDSFRKYFTKLIILSLQLSRKD